VFIERDDVVKLNQHPGLKRTIFMIYWLMQVWEKKMRPFFLRICLIPISRIALDIINLGSVLLLMTEIELHILW